MLSFCGDGSSSVFIGCFQGLRERGPTLPPLPPTPMVASLENERKAILYGSSVTCHKSVSHLIQSGRVVVTFWFCYVQALQSNVSPQCS